LLSNGQLACRYIEGRLGEEESTAREAFGDGAVWCGCVLLRWGLYKLNAVETHTLKARGFKTLEHVK
jgi:hypothetical protein